MFARCLLGCRGTARQYPASGGSPTGQVAYSTVQADIESTDLTPEQQTLNLRAHRSSCPGSRRQPDDPYLRLGPGSGHPGTVTGYPPSSGATAPSASRSAATEHSASHLISGTLSGRPRCRSRMALGVAGTVTEMSERAGGLDQEVARWTGRTAGGFIQDVFRVGCRMSGRAGGPACPGSLTRPTPGGHLDDREGFSVRTD